MDCKKSSIAKFVALCVVGASGLAVPVVHAVDMATVPATSYASPNADDLAGYAVAVGNKAYSKMKSVAVGNAANAGG